MRKSIDQKPPLAAWATLSRDEAGMSVEEVVEALAVRGHTVRAATIRGIEGGSKRASARLARLMADVYGVQPPATHAATPAPADQDELVAALRDQTAAISSLVEVLAERTPRVVEESAPYAEAPVAGNAAVRLRYWLNRARERLDMKREEVDRRLNLRAGQYGRWEDGKSVPKGAQLVRLAELLRVPVSILEDPLVTDDDRLAAWQSETLAPATRRSA